MDAVVLHGTPLVEDPNRVKKVRALGIDETSFLSATREHHTIYVTGLVDLNLKGPSNRTRPIVATDRVVLGTNRSSRIGASPDRDTRSGEPRQ